MELLELIKSLSEKERTRLTELLSPVVAARKAYMDFVLIQMPADFAKKEGIEKKRTPLLQSKTPKDQSKLAELDRQLIEAREKIDGRCKEGWRMDGHLKKREALQKEINKAKENFAKHY